MYLVVVGRLGVCTYTSAGTVQYDGQCVRIPGVAVGVYVLQIHIRLRTNKFEGFHAHAWWSYTYVQAMPRGPRCTLKIRPTEAAHVSSIAETPRGDSILSTVLLIPPPSSG
jgi:hypothetical protein